MFTFFPSRQIYDKSRNYIAEKGREMEIFLASHVAKIIFVALRETEICSAWRASTLISQIKTIWGAKRRLKGQKFVEEKQKKKKRDKWIVWQIGF